MRAHQCAQHDTRENTTPTIQRFNFRIPRLVFIVFLYAIILLVTGLTVNKIFSLCYAQTANIISSFRQKIQPNDFNISIFDKNNVSNFNEKCKILANLQVQQKLDGARWRQRCVYSTSSAPNSERCPPLFFFSPNLLTLVENLEFVMNNLKYHPYYSEYFSLSSILEITLGLFWCRFQSFRTFLQCKLIDKIPYKMAWKPENYISKHKEMDTSQLYLLCVFLDVYI